MLHIVAIGWLWVAFMMAITERSIVAGVMTFVFYGLVPCSILIYLLATPARRRRARKAAQSENPDSKDGKAGVAREIQ